jgi:O-antigen/teichoic acid export membrane protein
MENQPVETPSTARGMYHLFLGNVTSTILLAITAIVVGRLIGPEGYGLYTLALVTPSYVMLVINLGIPSAAVRFSAKYLAEGSERKAISFLYSMTVFQTLLGIIAFVLLVPFSGLIATRLLNRPDLAPIIPLACLVLVGLASYNTVTAGYQGLNRMDRSAFLQVLLAVAKLVLTLALIWLGFGLVGAVAGFAVSYVVSGLIGLALVIVMYKGIMPRGWLADLKDALKYSYPLFVATLASGLVAPYLVNLLAIFVTNAQIGGYGAATNMSTLIVLFTYPIATTLFPLFSGLSKDERGLAEIYEKTVRYSTIFVIPVVALVMVLAYPISSAIYGKAYEFAGSYLALMVAQYLFIGLGSQSQGALLNGIGETRKTLVASMANSVTVIVLSTALIPFLGVYGAIVAIVIGDAAFVVVAWRIVGRRLGANVRLSSIWRIYLASGVAAALVYPLSFLPLDPLIVTLLGGTIFLLLVIPLMALTRTVGREDMEALDGYFRSIRPVSFLFRIALRYYEVFDRNKNR